MKILVTILNYNMPQMTDSLFEMLNPYKEDLYDIMVLDNGSPPEGKSKYTTHESGVNTYYGGGLNLTFDYMLENKEYDALFILNNDIIAHPYNFVKNLKDELIDNDYTILSPSILQPTHDQGFWRQMHNWGSGGVRQVDWVDFMSPMIHRRLIDEIKQYDNDLIYGWGQDYYSGMLCEEKGWKVGVSDTTTILHLTAQTYKSGKSSITMSDYTQKAYSGLINYFGKIKKYDRYEEYKSKAQNYRWEKK